jgi:ferritin-like metal-binding protein YciE
MTSKEPNMTDTKTAPTKEESPKGNAIADWVGDIVNIESHIEEALDRQLNLKPGTQDVAQAIQHFHDTVRASKYRAQDYQKSLGKTKGGGLQETAADLLGKAAGLIDKVRKDTVTKALRDDYVAFNLAAVGYTLLHTTALALKDQRAVEFAEKGLETYAGLVQRVNSVLPQATIDDLVKNDEVPVADASVAAQARATIDRVWKQTSN